MKLTYGTIIPRTLLKSNNLLVTLRKIQKIENIWAGIHTNRMSPGERLESLTKLRHDFLAVLGDTKIKTKIYQEYPFLRFSKAFLGESPLGEQEFNLNQFASLISIPHVYGVFLFLLINRLRFRRVLELGTGFGISTTYMLEALQLRAEGFIETVEKLDLPFKYYDILFNKFNRAFYRIIRGRTEIVLPQLLETGSPYDLAFLDATHEAEQITNETQLVWEKLSLGGIMIIDDIDWSPATKVIWGELIHLDGLGYHATFLWKNRARLGLLLKVI